VGYMGCLGAAWPSRKARTTWRRARNLVFSPVCYYRVRMRGRMLGGGSTSPRRAASGAAADFKGLRAVSLPRSEGSTPPPTSLPVSTRSSIITGALAPSVYIVRLFYAARSRSHTRTA
jgi:hypothetical protein